MKLDFNSEKPIFMQICDGIEDAIITGAYPEETQVPSTTEIAAAFKINPATALKGMNALVESEILYKKRGIGMFVSAGAKQRIIEKRRSAFYEEYVQKLAAEAKKLGLSAAEVAALVVKSMKE
jgi:GntR family transcriptional regulator